MRSPASEMVDLREAYGEALVNLGKKNERVVVLDADVAHPTFAHLFARQFPERFFQMGVAEQNMMGVAAGLAASGFIPFPTTLAVFASKRALDQVSISIAYTNLNVKVVGSYSGLTSPNTGATHQAIDDIASMRAMPNMKVVVPADAVEVQKAVFGIAQETGPAYLRIARCKAPIIFDDNYRFKSGKAVVLRWGVDVALVSTGVMTSRCIEAAEQLREDRIESTVLHVSTVKPIDISKVVEVAEKTGAVVTVENHSIIGGLGSAISEVLCENRPCPMERVGVRDTFGESSENMENLFRKYGLTTKEIVKAAKALLRKKKQ